ncbi:hypothetical protein P9757_12065, partial [Geobacillus stearothermophilus]|nr:hypothetical protein [Geobacillus stearothermophilus]
RPFAFFYRASLGGPDERREQKFATLVGDHFGMSPTNILLTPIFLWRPRQPRPARFSYHFAEHVLQYGYI